MANNKKQANLLNVVKNTKAKGESLAIVSEVITAPVQENVIDLQKVDQVEEQVFDEPVQEEVTQQSLTDLINEELQENPPVVTKKTTEKPPTVKVKKEKVEKAPVEIPQQIMDKETIKTLLREKGFTVNPDRPSDGNTNVAKNGKTSFFMDWNDKLMAKNGYPVARFGYKPDQLTEVQAKHLVTYKTYAIGGNWPKGVAEIKLDSMEAIEVLCQVAR